MRNYDDPEYKKWRNAIKLRDKNKCQWPNCVQKNQPKHCHHIRKWADNPLLRYNVDNGITLCKFHHKMIEGQEDLYIGIFTQIVVNKKMGPMLKKLGQGPKEKKSTKRPENNKKVRWVRTWEEKYKKEQRDKQRENPDPLD